jgi:hypothetical protein
MRELPPPRLQEWGQIAFRSDFDGRMTAGQSLCSTPVTTSTKPTNLSGLSTSLGMILLMKAYGRNMGR